MWESPELIYTILNWEQLSDVHIVSYYSNMRGSAAADSFADFSKVTNQQGGLWAACKEVCFLTILWNHAVWDNEQPEIQGGDDDCIIAWWGKQTQTCFIPFLPPPLFLHSKSHGAGGTRPTYALLQWKHPRGVCACTFVCMHASKCVIMQVSELCFLTPCCRFLFFFASLFLSLDACCCISI